MLNRRISKEEIIADTVFILVAMITSAIAIFIFDIHGSFYPGNEIIPPSKFIFKTTEPYYIGIPAGGIVGFLLLKLLFFGFKKEEEAVRNNSKKEGITITVKKDNRAYVK